MKLAILLLALLVSSAQAQTLLNNYSTFASAVTATGPQTKQNLKAGAKTFWAAMTTTADSGSATVTIEGTLDAGLNWLTLCTLTITNTAPAAQVLTSPSYAQYRANITAISGTGAAVTVYEGQ